MAQEQINILDLSIVIPSYMEEENLRVLLPRIISSVNMLNIPYEILVIDAEQPKDNTKEVCSNHGVIHIYREGGNYYGDAVRTGIKKALGKYILFMDADGSHSPEFIKDMYESRQDYDIVIASRYIYGGGSDNTRALIFMSWAVNFTYSILFNLNCKDVSNSFKLYKRDLIESINLKSNNFDIIEELLIKLKRKNNNLSIIEIPYFFKERMFGKTKRSLLTFAFSYLYTLLRLKLID